MKLTSCCGSVAVAFVVVFVVDDDVVAIAVALNHDLVKPSRYFVIGLAVWGLNFFKEKL